MLQKVENYQNALKRLEEAIARYQASTSDTLYRDGLIQRFEFTFELAWKSLKEYMEDQGMVLTIVSRNLMSHIYDEETAISIADRVSSEFIIPLTALAEFYKKMAL